RNRSLERIEAVAADARAAAVLTSAAAGSAVERLTDQVPSLQALRWVISDQVSDDAAQAWREPALGRESLALLQYTSGSTALPRGVMVTHGNLLHNCDWIHRRFEHSSESRGVVWLPPYHDMGLIGGIVQPLYGGFPCYLLSP